MQCSRKFFLFLLLLGMIMVLYLLYNIPQSRTTMSDVYQSTNSKKISKDNEQKLYKEIQFDKDKFDVFSFVHVQKTGGTTFERNLVFNIKDGNCHCEKTSKPSCMCFRKDMQEIWLVCRYIQPKWPCGLHPDFETLRQCTPKFMEDLYDHQPRRYFYGTVLREPVLRFLSEFRHVQRGASWEAVSVLCRGKLLNKQNPTCYDGTMWHNVTLEKFLRCPYNLAINRQTWMLSNISNFGCDFKQYVINPTFSNKLLNTAKQNLRSIAYFGLLEYPKQSQYIFEKTFNMEFIERFDLAETGYAKEYMKSEEDNYLMEELRTLNALDIELYRYARNLFFERYRYFVEKYGPPMYKKSKTISIASDKLERIKKNLPKSSKKESRLKERRERDIHKLRNKM